MNRFNALYGALVSDAACLGLHWLYDPVQIESVSQQGELLFRAPDGAVYEGKPGVFVHSDRRSGDLSHYGESARIVGEIVLREPYSVKAHQEQFFSVFGPCGSFVGYADRPTKQLVSRILIEKDQIPEASGMDDNQMPAFCVLPALIAVNQDLEGVFQAAEVISTNTDVRDGLEIVHHCVQMLEAGKSLHIALEESTRISENRISKLLQQAFELDSYQPVDVGEAFGRACYVDHALPVVWHLMKYAESFEQVVRDNIRCGGDSCGRSMVLGALAGLVFPLPESMVAKVSRGSLPTKLFA